MWYSEKDFQALDVDKRSLVTAFANLAQKFDVSVDPVDFYATLTQEGDDTFDWYNVAEYVDGIDIGHINEDGSWPTDSIAVVKFRRLDNQAAGLVDHYCLVADANQRSIVDSLDATIKSAVEYGQVLGYATYVPEKSYEPIDLTEQLDTVPVDRSVYVLAQGENLWDAARKLNIKPDTLVEFNQIEDPRRVHEGAVLRIPPATHSDHKDVIYELLDTPIIMHVTAPNGTTKFSFGNATKWSDIKPTTRRYQFAHQVVVTAIAHVPLTDEVESAKYYMESIDVGSYPNGDNVRFAVGFSHSHLKEGPYAVPTPPPAPKPRLQPRRAPILVMPDEPALVTLKPEPVQELIKPTPEPKPVMTENPDPLTWKNTQHPLNEEKKPVLYLANESMMVHDLDGKRTPKPLPANRGVMIYSTFEKDGVLYGRPMQSARTGSWYGIPMDKLLLEDEVYNTSVSLADRVLLHGSLTLQEKGVVALSKILSQGTRFKTIIKKQTRR